MDAAVLDHTLDTLAADDLSSATDAELHARMLTMLRGRVRLDGLLYATIDVWDSRSIWSGDGSKSPASRLKAETGIAKADASTIVRRSRKLRSMPLVAAAVIVGRLQPGCVDAMFDARKLCADIFDQHEQALVDACVGIGVDEARRVIRNWIRHHDPDGDEKKAKKRHGERQLSAAATFDGMVHLNGLLPAVGGQEFLAELNRLERQLYDHDQNTNSPRTAGQRRADALVLMSQRSATLDIDEYHAGRSPRISLILVLGMNTAEHLCETLAGVPIPAFGIVPTLSRCDIERIWFDGPDQPITTSPRRTFTGALRNAIQVRDQRCTHPSVCDAPAQYCDIDHIDEHANGGSTSLDNGRVHCPRHNRNPQLRNATPTGWRIRRPPRGWIPHTPDQQHPDDEEDGDGPDEPRSPGTVGDDGR